MSNRKVLVKKKRQTAIGQMLKEGWKYLQKGHWSIEEKCHVCGSPHWLSSSSVYIASKVSTTDENAEYFDTKWLCPDCHNEFQVQNNDLGFYMRKT